MTDDDKIVPINRQQRRALARAIANPPVEVGLPQLCVAGKHALKRVEGTLKGDVIAVVVICAKCRRTFQEILDEDPAYAEMYEAWKAAGEPDDWPPTPAVVALD